MRRMKREIHAHRESCTKTVQSDVKCPSSEYAQPKQGLTGEARRIRQVPAEGPN